MNLFDVWREISDELSHSYIAEANRGSILADVTENLVILKSERQDSHPQMTILPSKLAIALA
jgi:hypothetical protein